MIKLKYYRERRGHSLYNYKKLPFLTNCVTLYSV